VGKKAGSAIIDLGMPVGNPTKLTDGKPGKSDSRVCGFSILQAESSPALNELLKGHPHFMMGPGSAIEVHEFLSMPGMP
jgi:hypothetical protein